MNDYIELRIDASPCNETITDILAAMLAEEGYESFVPDDNGLTAYISDKLFNAKSVQNILSQFPILDVEFSISDTFIEGKDWNAEWEKNYFKPIVVGDQCVIHSSFHTDIPQCPYDIVIDPKMAFGTGHHATTSLIIERLLSIAMEGKHVIDMGTGTGILALLCAMRGAASVDAVEIDPFAQENAVENVKLNHHPEINVILGDASVLPSLAKADLFLANINRNIILGDIDRYASAMNSGAQLILSGFYVEDIPMLQAAAEPLGLATVNFTQRDNWASLLLQKN